MEKLCPFVLRSGKPVCMAQHGNQDLKHVMTSDTRRQGKHYIYDYEFALGESMLRQEFFQEQVKSYKDEYVEYNVEEERYSHRMAGISDYLHLYDPVTVYRYQYDSDHQRAEGNALMLCFVHL